MSFFKGFSKGFASGWAAFKETYEEASMGLGHSFGVIFPWWLLAIAVGGVIGYFSDELVIGLLVGTVAPFVIMLFLLIMLIASS